MSVLGEIGATVIYLRKEKGLTQERLALECAISVSYLRLIEHGNANPTINELWRIAEVLGVELRNPLLWRYRVVCHEREHWHGVIYNIGC